jgi:hypothetical protein
MHQINIKCSYFDGLLWAQGKQINKNDFMQGVKNEEK